MNLQGRNLFANLTGADVALLQTEMAQLGYTIATPEIGRQLYGPTTQQAVQDFQRKHGLPVSGIVDAPTAKLINAAVDAIVPARFSVSGVVRHQDGTVLGGLTVRADDVEFRGKSEALSDPVVTNPAGQYQITSADKFRHAERRTADVSVHVSNAEGVELAVSPIFYNAPAALTIDVTVGPIRALPTPEYQATLATLAPLTDGTPPSEFTAQDIVFLTNETGIAANLLLTLQQSASVALESDQSAEAVYAWFRLNLPPVTPPDLDHLLDVPLPQLRAAIPQAVAANIVSARLAGSLDAIINRVDRLQRERASAVEATFTPRQFMGQLLDQQTSAPLVRFRVQGFDLDAGSQPKDLGTRITNAGGSFGFTYTTPPAPSSAPPPATRRLRLLVLDPDGAQIQQVDVQAAVDQQQPDQIRVAVPVVQEPPTPALTALATTLNLNVPQPLLDFLGTQGIHSLSDVRKAGGISHLALPLAADDPAVRMIEAHASLSRLSSDVQFNHTLIGQNYTSLTAIANANRADFVGAAQPIGDFKAARMHVNARAQARFLDNVGMDLRVKKTNGYDHPTQPGGNPALLSMLHAPCGCDDCQAAVSPLAYLADLLDYAVRHVKNKGKAINLQFLTGMFHQPFGELPTSCEQMDKQVRQVRICIEVLRSHMTANSLPAAGSPQQTVLVNAERTYIREAYATLLNKIGTSSAEIRLARAADADTRRALAERLGIDLGPAAQPDNLEKLFFDPVTLLAIINPAVVLETLFGLVDTTRDPLSDGARSSGGFEQFQITRWKLNGVKWGRNTDPDGTVYLTLDAVNGFRVSLFQDPQRTNLLAQGSRSSAQGRVVLSPRNGSGLSGSIELAYTTGSTAISISAVPKLLSWRYQRLRTLWRSQDWPADFYSDRLFPIVDPDLIGPDDFRNPDPNAGPNTAFGLWLHRRQIVENDLSQIQLVHRNNINKGLDPMLKASLGTSLAGLDAVAAMHESTDKEKAAKQDAIVKLHLTVESLARLIVLGTKAKLAANASNPQVSSDEWTEVIAILAQAAKVARYQSWILEEHQLNLGSVNGLLPGPQDFWLSLREPVEGDWPPTLPDKTPLIDPDAPLKLDELPEPAAGKVAIALWQARRDRLVQIADDLKTTYGQSVSAPFDPLLQQAVGPLPAGTDIDALYAALNGTDQAAINQATAAIGSGLFMPADDFNRLMAVKNKKSPVDSDWAEVLVMLGRAQKVKREFPTWLQEEQSAGLSAAQYWLVRKARLPRWRASTEDRAAWQQALRVRSGAPVIDPDLIGPGDLQKPFGVDRAPKIWNDRAAWVAANLAWLKTVREAAANPIAGLDIILQIGLGITQDELGVMDQDRQTGKSLEKRLGQLTLPMASFSHLVRVLNLLSASQTVLAEEWDDVYAILTEVGKQRLFAQWRREEQTLDVMLGPDEFRFPDPPPLTFPPQQPVPLAPWLAARNDRQDWQDTLQSRMDQEQTVAAALSQAIGSTEEATLPKLRDALVWASMPPFMGLFADLDASGKWMGDHLLIDAKTGGCQQTTRIAQAIETVQGLLFSLRQRILHDTYKDLSLDADHFDREWEWIGSYATWRAAMFVYLYPENILIPSLRRWQTPAFRVLIDNVRSNRRLTPDQAREAAGVYSSYFRDVCKLNIQASCQTKSRLYNDGVAAGFSYLFYMFAQGGETRTVYWSAYDPGDKSDYAQTFWEAVPGLANVMSVVGAAPFEMVTGQRYIYLFLIVLEKGVKKLAYARYDLDQRRWDGEPQDLDLPDDATDFSAVVLQRGREDIAPALALKLIDVGKQDGKHLRGTIYTRMLNADGSDWAGEDWVPIAGGVGRSPCAWVENSSGSCFIVRSSSGQIEYRLFGTHDDGHWVTVSTGGEEFQGAFRWLSSEVLLFRGKGSCQAIKPQVRKLEYSAFPLKDAIHSIELWLNAVAGVSLRHVDYKTPWGSVPLYEWLTITPEAVVNNPALVGVDPIVSLLGFALAANPGFWDQKVWEVNRTKLIKDILDIQQIQAISWLQCSIDEAADFRDKKFGAWKLANSQVWAFTKPRLTLGDLLKGGINGTAVDVLQRSATSPADELSAASVPIALLGRIVPNSGVYPWPDQQFAFDNANHSEVRRCAFSRSGEMLSLLAEAHVAPMVTGTFDIQDGFSQDKLQLRRESIKLKFIANDNGGPRTNLTYLEEAWYFVPVHLALQLQSRGEFTAAFDWLRNVYDYSMPVTQRKIYYGLVREEAGTIAYHRPENWLLDPLNPHEIAATRPDTYTRFTLIALIRCFSDHACSEFTFDTAESVPRARLLYLTALELLDTSALKPHNACGDVIGGLYIQVGDPYWAPVWNAMQKEISSFADAATLTNLANAIKITLNGPGTWSARLGEARSLLDAAKDSLPQAPSLDEIVSGKSAHQTKFHAALLGQPDVSASAERAGALGANDFHRAVSLISGVTTEGLEQGNVALPWLRAPSADSVPGTPVTAVPLTLQRSDFGLAKSNVFGPTQTSDLATAASTSPMSALNAISSTIGFVPAPSYAFCIPPNPLLNALRLHAELDLYKLRTCRNIAGMKRELDPYAAPTDTFTGLPVIGAGGQLVLPGLAKLRPTPYRYTVLIERAKQMAGQAQQVEAAFLSSLISGDNERYSKLKARQDLETARAGVRLQTLRVKAAQDGVKLSQLQQQKAQIQVANYQAWLSAGESTWEQLAVSLMIASAALSIGAADAHFAVLDAAGGLSSLSGAASAGGGAAQYQAALEQRAKEWQLQEALAQQDVLIDAQQVTIAEDQVRVTDQELNIAVIQTGNAQDTVNFLANKFTNVDLYDWMSDVLEGVYSFFLQQATSLAQLAASQLAFERQEVPPPFIQADYWQAPSDAGVTTGSGKAPDRRGLTGSARLLEDISQLDQYAFETNRRKAQLTRTISLAQQAPAEFQRFRETGVLPFDTPLEGFDREFPGDYLRLIRRVRVSVIALIPPSQGIRATLSTTGTSRVVIGGDLFQTVRVHRPPEQVAFCSPNNATGLFELDQQPEMLLPFEGIGVDTHWEFRMLRAANRIDYRTIADVLVTIEFTALSSFDYQQQVLQTLRPRIIAERPFSFRNQFADQWYDLNNPDQTATPMTVSFTTVSDDFPPNLDDVKIQQVLLYFARADGQSFEVPVTSFRFTEEGGSGPVGGAATSLDGIISTRQGNAGGWTAMIGRTPFGRWDLALPNQQEIRGWFQKQAIQDMLFVVTFSGRTPEWPA